MKLNINHPDLTAYALGELNETDARKVEVYVRENPEAARVIEEIKATARLLETELQSESLPALNSDQRRRLEKKIGGESFLVWDFSWMRARWLAPVAVVVMVVMGVRQYIEVTRPENISLNPAATKPPLVVRMQEPVVNSQPMPAQPITAQAVANEPKVKPPSSAKEQTYFAKGDSEAKDTNDGKSRVEAVGGLAEVAVSKKIPPEPRLIPTENIAGAVINGADKHSNANAGSGSTLDLAAEETSIEEPAVFSPAVTAGNSGAATAGIGVRDSVAATQVMVAQNKLAVNSGLRQRTAPAEIMDLGAGRRVSDGGQAKTGETKRANKKPAKSIQTSSPDGDTGDTEHYDYFKENSFTRVTDEALSTFSIDVDTAAYANVRRFLTQGQLPPKDAVRLEEMINYFSYNYAEPIEGRPFSVNLEMAAAPWDGSHQLVRIGLKGQALSAKNRPRANLVFLIDVSGSMKQANKLPLLQQSMKMLIKQLEAHDRVAIVVYAGRSGVVLPSTSGSDQQKILKAIDQLHAKGGTNGGQGIEAAYRLASENFVKGGINRVLLATDGDFNVGLASEGDLIRLIQEKAKTGVFLSVLGFGSGNLKDSMMVKLADKGNGHYAYIDDLKEAKKVLVEEIAGTLITIAKDVKVQVEFNPKYISAYRLVGYEKRALRNQEFSDDKVDAGEIGAGHTVTVLYEVVKSEPLKYQSKKAPAPTASTDGLTVKLRYKQPEGKVSELIEVPMKYEERNFTESSSDFQFACSVASFGMLLRESEHKATTSFKAIADLAEKHTKLKGISNPYRQEFVELVKKASRLSSEK
jgi:Ca-activated chloride channel family protein